MSPAGLDTYPSSLFVGLYAVLVKLVAMLQQTHFSHVSHKNACVRFKSLWQPLSTSCRDCACEHSITTDLVCPFHAFVSILDPNPGCVRLQMGVEGQLSVVSHRQVAPTGLKALSAAVPSPSGSRSALQERIYSAERRAVQMMLNKTRAILQEVSLLCLLLGVVQL